MTVLGDPPTPFTSHLAVKNCNRNVAFVTTSKNKANDEVGRIRKTAREAGDEDGMYDASGDEGAHGGGEADRSDHEDDQERDSSSDEDVDSSDVAVNDDPQSQEEPFTDLEHFRDLLCRVRVRVRPVSREYMSSIMLAPAASTQAADVGDRSATASPVIRHQQYPPTGP